MKKRKKIFLNIDKIKIRIEELWQNIVNIKLKIEKLKIQITDVKEEVKKCKVSNLNNKYTVVNFFNLFYYYLLFF
jgi:uncharacterized coiled-coil DUF342 family protein